MGWWDFISSLFQPNNDSGPYAGSMANPMGWLAALGTGAGIGGNIYSAVQGNKDANYLNQVAKQQPNWQAYYQPISDQASTAMRNALMKLYIGRGLSPDSGAINSLVGQGMAQQEQDNIYKAMELAQRHQMGMIDAAKANVGGRGTIASQLGNVSALPNYLAGQATRYDTNQARARQDQRTREFDAWYRNAMNTGNAATQSMQTGPSPISYPQNQQFSGDLDGTDYSTDYLSPVS